MQILQLLRNWSLLRRLLGKIPGPLLAKLTRLWKTYHLLRGTYENKLKSLHAIHGPLVQVAPREFSWEFRGPPDRQQLRDFEKFAVRGSSIAEPQAVAGLSAALKMERLTLNENLLDACDDRFLAILTDAAEKHTTVDMTKLLTRYAYDVMVTVTTGRRAGFLDESPKKETVLSALAGWKFHSILYGSYLRYHPFIKTVLNKLRSRSQGVDVLDPAMEVLDQAKVSPSSNDTETDEEAPVFPIAAMESRVALALAGADPAIALMLKVLTAISQDDQLQQRLVAEVTNGGLATPITFQGLVTRKLNMPHMHALIQQTLRSQHSSDDNLSFTVPLGAQLSGHIITAGCTLHVRSDNRNTNISDINTFGALEPGLAPELNRHLPAYNLWNQDHTLQDCHVILAAKLASRVLQHFNMASNGGNLTSVQVTLYQTRLKDIILNHKKMPAIPAKTNITPSDMDVLGENLGPSVTAELFRLFDPAQGSTFGRDSLVIGPITHSAARAALHHTIHRIYGMRLQHKTDVDNIMHFAAKNTNLKMNTFRAHQPSRGSRWGPPKKIHYPHVHPWYKDVVTFRNVLQQLRPASVNRDSSPPASVQAELAPPAPAHNKPAPPTSMHNKPSPPSSMRNKPSPPTSMHNKPSPPTSMHNKPSPPSSMHNKPSPPSSMYNKHSPPATMRNKPSPPATMRNKPSPPSSVQSKHSPPASVRNLPPSTAVRTAPAAEVLAWGGFAANMHQKAIDAKSAEGYALQQEKLAAINAEPKPAMRFKETFKLTAPSTSLKGPRRFLGTDQTLRDGMGNSIVTSSEGVVLSPPTAAAPPAPVARPAGFLPPHKRAELRKLEAEQAQKAAAAAANASSPQTISPLYQAAGTAMFVPKDHAADKRTPPSRGPSSDNSAATSPLQPSTPTRCQSAASSGSLGGILSHNSSD